jgi:hypothetical protein
MRFAPLAVAVSLASCTSSSPPATNPPPAGSVAAGTGPHFTVTPFALPGAQGSVSLDYLAIDRPRSRVWIPAGETGSVDVLDAPSGKMTRIEGFPTQEREARGQKRVVGPSSATIGEGFAYVGNRANSEICAVDLDKLVKGACLALPSAPDGLQYVATTKELWATTPKDKSITVLDASLPDKLAPKTKITLDGAPEGYAVDPGRGVFYTNLEDLDKTLVIDARTHKVTATWEPKCGSDGPRGLALDAAKGFLFVACTTEVKVLDAAHGGAQLSALPAGGGIDNIDYVDEKHQLYIAAGKTGLLTVARVDDKGVLSVLGTVATAPGTRVVVAGKDGSAYVADGKGARVLSVTLAP